jgi:hypothetical protein
MTIKKLFIIKENVLYHCSTEIAKQSSLSRDWLKPQLGVLFRVMLSGQIDQAAFDSA